MFIVFVIYSAGSTKATAVAKVTVSQPSKKSGSSSKSKPADSGKSSSAAAKKTGTSSTDSASKPGFTTDSTAKKSSGPSVADKSYDTRTFVGKDHKTRSVLVVPGIDFSDVVEGPAAYVRKLGPASSSSKDNKASPEKKKPSSRNSSADKSDPPRPKLKSAVKKVEVSDTDDKQSRSRSVSSQRSVRKSQTDTDDDNVEEVEVEVKSSSSSSRKRALPEKADPAFQVPVVPSSGKLKFFYYNVNISYVNKNM
jgi:hypothetical protein